MSRGRRWGIAHGTGWIACAALVLSPQGVSAQDFGIGALFEKARGIALAFQFGELQSGNLESDDSCPLGAVCGASAELLIDLADFGGDVSVELGLSASYWRGFRSSDPRLDLRGSVRNFPTIAAYMSKDLDPWSPYAGLSFGLSDLWNAQAYDADGAVYPLDGQTFDWSAVAGLGYGLGPAIVISEIRYAWRTFSSLTWTLPGGSEVLPAGFPRSLELSGFKMSVGLQFQFQDAS
ncbi:MAG: hypothetical protein KC645_15115 [Gemmatimonadetes bacterium]|nr:hypothetical protein [Gemmatimonadota bacterium]